MADRSDRIDWRLAALLFGAVALVYLPSLFNGFVWDDDRFLTANPLIHASDGLRRFWFSTEAPDYFPLTSTTLWIEWRLWGMNAAGYHAVNVLLHAVSCVMLWRVFARLGFKAAFLAALLFGLHPVAVQSVAWITERKNTLCFFFGVLATLLFLRADDEDSPRMRALSIGAFVLSLLAKTATVTLPVTLLALCFLRRGRVDRRDLLRVAPFFTASFVLGLVTVWFQYSVNIADEVVRTDPFLRRAQIAGWALWFYLKQAVLPTDLSFIHEVPELPSGIWGWIHAILATAFLGGILRLGRGGAVAAVHFVALLLPVLGFLDIYFMRYAVVSDHWAYFALPAISLFYFWRFDEVPASHRRASYLVCVGLCLVFGTLTVREQFQYRDEEALWRSTAARNGSAWLALNNLGAIEHSRGNLLEAQINFMRAVSAWPDYREAHYNLANVLRDAGHPDEALRHYAVTVRIDPGFARAWNNAGNLLLAQGRAAEAVAHLRKAADLQSDDPSCAANLASALAAAGESVAAEREYRRALELDPAHVAALNGMGILRASLSDNAGAADWFAKAVAADPANVEARFNLASALDLGGDPAAAIPHYREALRLSPGNVQIANYLAEALDATGQADEAAAIRRSFAKP